MEKFIDFLQKYLTPVANKLNNQRHFSAVISGMRVSFPLILFGAFINIIGNPPMIDGANAGIFSGFITGWQGLVENYGTIIKTPYNMTMGCMSLVTAFAIAYQLAKSYKLEGITYGAISMMLFLMVAAPFTNGYLAASVQGVSDISTVATTSVMSTGFLGFSGFFTAILIGIVSVEIAHMCNKYNIGFKFPESVPPFIATAFNSIIVLVLDVLIIYGLNVVLLLTLKASLPAVLMGILMPAINSVDSVVVMVILCLVGQLFWCIGIHGGIVNVPLIPIFMTACLANSEIVMNGGTAEFSPIMLMTYWGCVGGMGCSLALSILMVRSKSTQLKVIGKAGIIPSLFNVSEPIIFGTPIMMNPVMMIPFIFAPIVVILLAYAGFSTGIMAPTYIPILSALPIGVTEFLSSGSFANFLFPVVALPIAILIYYPFFKVYEKQLIEKEASEN